MGVALEKLSRYDEAIDRVPQEGSRDRAADWRYLGPGQCVRQHRHRFGPAQPIRRGDRVPQEAFRDRAADWWVLANQSAVFRKSNFSLICPLSNISGGGIVCYNIARAYEEQQDQASALGYIKRAHEALQSCYGAGDHPHSTIAAQRQVEALHRLENPCRCELAVFRTEHVGYGCDGCGMRAPQGTTLHGCRECDFDLCSPCAENRQL
jgi:hypothetical protein